MRRYYNYVTPSFDTFCLFVWSVRRNTTCLFSIKFITLQIQYTLSMLSDLQVVTCFWAIGLLYCQLRFACESVQRDVIVHV